MTDGTGHAFPTTHTTMDGATHTYSGISLRDWFAGQAMAGMLADTEVAGSAEAIAERSYKMADAIVTERSK